MFVSLFAATSLAPLWIAGGVALVLSWLVVLGLCARAKLGDQELIDPIPPDRIADRIEEARAASIDDDPEFAATYAAYQDAWAAHDQDAA